MGLINCIVRRLGGRPIASQLCAQNPPPSPRPVATPLTARARSRPRTPTPAHTHAPRRIFFGVTGTFSFIAVFLITMTSLFLLKDVAIKRLEQALQGQVALIARDMIEDSGGALEASLLEGVSGVLLPAAAVLQDATWRDVPACSGDCSRRFPPYKTSLAARASFADTNLGRDTADASRAVEVDGCGEPHIQCSTARALQQLPGTVLALNDGPLPACARAHPLTLPAPLPRCSRSTTRPSTLRGSRT